MDKPENETVVPVPAAIWDGLLACLGEAITLVCKHGDLTGVLPRPADAWEAWLERVDALMTRAGVPDDPP